jgi:hypothetical protein
MTTLTWRHLSRHWRSNLAVLLCLTLACALVASLSGYSDAIAARELSRTWEGASPAQRSLLFTGPRDTFTEELYANLQAKLGGLVQDRMVIRHATLAPDPPLSTDGIGQGRAVTRLDVYSFEPLSENVRVVEGRLPESVDLMKDREPWRPPPIEAVLGVRAAAQSGYRVGDQLTASSKYHRLDIVGIVEPLDPRADIWGEDLSAFTTMTSTLPLIIDSYSMQSFYPMRPVFPHDIAWRITLNPLLLHVENAAALRSNLINLQTQSATVHAVTSTGLVPILADYLARLSRLRMAFWLLIAQTLIVVLCGLAIFAPTVAERSHNELATLSARGASSGQITRVLALEKLVLAATAAILGLVFALGAIPLWAASTGDALPLTLSSQTWVLSGVVAAIGWLTLVGPVLLAARHQIGGHRWYARPPQTSAIQKRYIDLYLFAFGALLYWQLNQADSFVMSRLGNTVLADPLLLIGPTLLLVAGALVLLRVLPFLLKKIAWVLHHWRGLTLWQALERLSRDTSQPGREVLLVSLTTGLVLFSGTLAVLLGGSPEAMGRHMAGALQLNALSLVLFSGMVFFFAHLVAAQGKAREWGLLRALGLRWHQWLTMQTIEGAVVLCLGLVSGAVVGLGLSRIMLPFLAQALAAWQLGSAIEQAMVSWRVVAQSYVLLIAVYGSALALLALVLVRTREQWAVWREEE